MKIDFEPLLTDTYELYLPTPVFSVTAQNNLLIEEGVLFSDALIIENPSEGIFCVHIEVTGPGLKVDATYLEGNHIDLGYKIDTKGFEIGDVLKSAMVFTFLGGEKRIEFTTTIIPKKFEINSDMAMAPVVKTYNPVKIRPFYQINTNKKSYQMNEPAKLMIINNDIYPMNVKVISTDEDLQYLDQSVTIKDIGFIEIYYKRPLLKKIFQKNQLKEEPIIVKEVTIEVRSEHGIENLNQRIIFTSYEQKNNGMKIQNEKAYKRCLNKVQSSYTRYLLEEKKKHLKESIELAESALSYHLGDVGLRLFYINMMIESGDVDGVNLQLSQLLKHKGYYMAKSRREFGEVIATLYDWLKGEDVTKTTKEWPLTPYRQWFKMQLFDQKEHRYETYEKLYLSGMRSPFLNAKLVAYLNEKPMIPFESSVYYRFILRWAINKNAMSPKWLSTLEVGYYQLIKYDLVDSNLCYQLYSMEPSQNFLKLLCTSLIKESYLGPKGYAIYYEVLKHKLYIKDVITIYIKSAFHNRLPIDMAYVQLTSANPYISHDEMVYLFREYVDTQLPDQYAFGPYVRLYNEVLSACVHPVMSEDESFLILREIEVRLYKHQWKELKDLVKKGCLSQLVPLDEHVISEVVAYGIKGLDYEWLEEQFTLPGVFALLEVETRTMYLNYLVNKKRYDNIIDLYRKNLLKNIQSPTMIKLAEILWQDHSILSYDIAMSLYKKGETHVSILKIISEDHIGELKDLLHLFFIMEGEHCTSKKLMEKIMFRGVWIRQHQELILKVYQTYRTVFKTPLIEASMNRFFAAQILIEEMYGSKNLISIFEQDLYNTQDTLPIGLALLKLYQLFGEKNDIIANNIVKNSVKNGIIFPWFAELAVPFLEASHFRKGTFFSYHSQSFVKVWMYYRSDDQQGYNRIQLKHVAFGLYIGYIVTFYQDHIDYYFLEEDALATKEIKSSDIFIQERFIDPSNNDNSFDLINTALMSQVMSDDESMTESMKHYMNLRRAINEKMMIL